MRDRDSTEKLIEEDVKPPTTSRPAAAPEGETAPRAEKELTDEQIGAVVGGFTPNFTKIQVEC